MKINNRLVLIAAVCVALGWTTACQKSASPQNTVVHNQPTNTTPTNANQPETNKAETNKSATNTSSDGGSLATPTDAYKTAYAARQKKDLEGLKRTLSKKALEFFTEIGKAEKKTLDDQLTELVNRPQAPKAEVRDEKIDGDKAKLEYLDEKGKWREMDFVKEDGDWKLTIPEAE